MIGLYPDLLPADYRKQLHYPNPLPTLSGAELEKAHLALIEYLIQVGLCFCAKPVKSLVPELNYLTYSEAKMYEFSTDF